MFQSAFAQGLTSDPLDKTISFTSSSILSALPITVRTMFSRGEQPSRVMPATRWPARRPARSDVATSGYYRPATAGSIADIP